MIGIGSMGAMMSMLFNEFGIEVHFHDPSEENVRKLVQHADCADLISKLHRYNDYESLCKALKPPRLFLFSLPHGQPTENTLKALKPHLQKGDVIIDAGNEHWRKTEHRQRELQPDGIHFIGMGVSGGYQSARSGPSCSPGGTEEALTLVMPFLRRVAAKDANGNPCVTEIGRKGSGHFVKMVHNGIEQGMLSALCEAWGIMAKVLGMEQEEIADTFQKWDREGPLASFRLLYAFEFLTFHAEKKLSYFDRCRYSQKEDQ
jgi:6-phosphogluconate dehydrogenase